MEQVTIIIPNDCANLSSITGSFEVLTRANEFWQMQGNRSMLEIRLAGFVPELKLDLGFFSIHPMPIHEVKKTDLVMFLLAKSGCGASSTGTGSANTNAFR